MLLPPRHFHDGRDRRPLRAAQQCDHVGLLGTGTHYGVAGCLSGLARFRRPGRRLLWQFVSRGCDHLVVDPDRLKASLGNLPGIKLIWAALAQTADKEGWPAARFLAALGEQEMVERRRRRLERHLEEARLPPGKTIDAFDFDAVPMISKAQVQALAAGDAWLEKGSNLLCFGPPGGGKSHLRRRSAWP
jgi:hypothetical protein